MPGKAFVDRFGIIALAYFEREAGTELGEKSMGISQYREI